jgi:DHA1 family tetracycline resistance protein-like MFS transporter
VVAKLLPILGITFIDILGFSILIPIMPYYVQHFGASVIMVGVLFSTFGLCQFVAGPGWGNVSDRIGRKAVLVISQVGATIGWVMLAFAPTLAWVFAARIVEGISGGNISVTQAYVADRVEPEQRARAYGYVGAAFSAGFVLGPAAGGLLLAKYGYTMPFLLAAALQVVTLIVTIFFLPESVAEKGETAKAASLLDIPTYLADPRVSPVLVQKLSYSLGLYAWFAAFALILHSQLGLDASQTSYLFAVFGIMSVVFQLFVVGNVTERIGTRNASNVGFTSAALFFALMPVVHNVPALLITIVLFSLGLSLTNATLAALLTDAAPEGARGTVLGVGSSMESISAIIMPTISTSVLAFFGSAWTASVSLLFVAIALALGVMAKRREVAPAAD